ncbi:hypothetical protein IR151_17560 [Clostridioides sp. ES-S-0006-03]|uniref:hypothetical protein n=1 Tax=Clostridioides sp. ES-S-0006-03 TaxID=2770775 RepID=UPI001D0CA01B|nr:hypothetical protein [Clostridioides sp. ES-S-0006-03]
MAVNKKKCSCCGQEKYEERYFWKSYSFIYSDNGRLPVCKDCLKEIYNKLNDKYRRSIKALKHLCFNFDIYFDENLADELFKKKSEDFVDEYMKIINRNSKYRGKTSSDNIVEDIDVETYVRESNNKYIEIDEYLIDKWGDGYSNDEYLKLEKNYKKYERNFPSETLQQKEIIMSMCELKLEAQKCRVNQQYNDYDKLMKQTSAKMAELDIIPSKQKKYGDDNNLVYGTLLEIYEKKEPVPDALDSFKDVDGFKRMIDRYFVKPFKKVFGLDESNNYTYEDEL